MTDHNEAVGRLGKNNRLALLGSLSNGALGFILVIVLAQLGDDVTGVVFVAAGVFNIAMQSSVLGTDASLVKFLAPARKAGEETSLAPIIRTALVPVIGIAITLAILVAIFAGPIGTLFIQDNDSVAPSDVTTAIRIVAVVFPIGAIAMSLLAATRGLGNFVTTAGADQIARPATQLIGLAIVVLTGAGPVAATAVWVGPIIISALAAGSWLRKEVPPSDGKTIDTKDFWSFTRPHAGTGMLRVSIRWLDTLVVGALLGVGAAGVYTTATRLLKLGDFVNQATFQSAAPQIAEDLGTGNLGQATSVYRSASTWLVLATWPLYLGALFYAPEILQIVFGGDFVAGANALRILSATMLVASAVGPIEAVLVMSGRTKQNLVNNSVALALNVVLGILLIPPFGLEGAAIAWAISLLCTNLLPVFQVYRSLGMHVLSRIHIVTMAVIAAGFALAAALMASLDLAAIPTVIAGLALGAVPLLLFAFWKREALALDRLLPGKLPKKR